MTVYHPRSPHATVVGLVYFGRMLDKLRLKDQGVLPSDYNVGTRDWYFFDSRCVRFLRVSYPALKRRTLQGGTDVQILHWCFREGRKPTAEEIEIWSAFMRKRGWNDESTGGLEEEKAAAGLARRSDILTWFDLFDAEEGRSRDGQRARRARRQS